MILDNSKESEVTPYNTPIVCLFSVGDDGCGATPKDVYTVNFKDRIKPAPESPSIVSDFDSSHIMPFRWVAPDQDLNSDLRKYYFGRKTYERLNRIGYYFKVFDTRPQCHLRYADGTQISDTIYYDRTLTFTCTEIGSLRSEEDLYEAGLSDVPEEWWYSR